MSTVLGFVSRNYKTYSPPTPAKAPNALRFGILGAANIVPIAFINPARSHAEVVVDAVAARDPARAKAFAKKYSIPRTFDSYQELLDDPAIDAVYNPLPNGLHYEWTIKALKAGKHVLLEKPATNTAAEARSIFALAKEKNLVVLEAFHYRFHPAIQKVKEIVDSGVIGKPKGVEAEMGLPRGMIKEGDIRRNLSMGGGAVMDVGGYVISASRYVLSSNPTEMVHIQVNTFPEDKRVDRSTRSIFAFPPPTPTAPAITAAIYGDLAMPPLLGFIPRLPLTTIRVDCEEGSVYCNNFVAPSVYHTITIKRGHLDQARYEYLKAYEFGDHDGKKLKGEVWWTTYRYMLEAFVDKVQGREPQAWVTPEDTIANMEAIELFYENSGLGVRPASTYDA